MYYGTTELESEKKYDVMKLAKMIKEFQDKFTGGVEEKTKREKKRRLRTPLTVYGGIASNPVMKLLSMLGMKGMETDKELYEKTQEEVDYGDSSQLEQYETMFTSGMAGEEADVLEKMIKEQRGVPYKEAFFGERVQDLGLLSQILGLVSPLKTLGVFKQGGYVPKKYYGGGSVSGNPTIADYFNNQGKTLGGSNKQSLAERLGRK